MDTFILRALALFQDDPIYWSGVALWLLGFAAYVPATCGRGPPVLSKTGAALCWLGFAITPLAHFALDGRYRLPPFETPTLDPAYWLRSSTQIWILWILGSALVIGGWLRWFTARVGARTDVVTTALVRPATHSQQRSTVAAQPWFSGAIR